MQNSYQGRKCSSHALSTLKRVAAACTALVMAASMLGYFPQTAMFMPRTAIVASAAEFEDYTYELNGDEAVITGYLGEETDVFVPDVITVTDEETLEEVKYPVTVIASGAFAKSKVTSVDLPDSVVEIEPGAFRGCTELTEISGGGFELVEGNLIVQGDTLVDYTSISYGWLVIPDEITAVADGVVVKDEIYGVAADETNISAFEAAKAAGVRFQSFSKESGDYRYFMDYAAGENGYEGLAILREYIGSDKDVIIPSEIDGNKVGVVSYHTFYQNETVETITIPDGMFLDYGALEQLGYLPKEPNNGEPGSLKEIIFEGSASLAPYSIMWCNNQQPFKITNMTEAVDMSGGNPFVGSTIEVDSPDGFYRMENNCLIDDNGVVHHVNVGIDKIVIPDGATGITDYAMCGWYATDTVEMPASVTSIAEEFTDLNIYIEAPEGSDAAEFAKENGFTKKVTEDGIVYKIDKNTNEARILGYEGTSDEMNIPEEIDGATVTAIDYWMPWNESTDKVRSVTIPGTVKEIRDGAFTAFGNLESVTLSEGVEYIGRYAFQSVNVSRFVIPASVKKIESTAFENARVLIYEFRGTDAEIGEKAIGYKYKDNDGNLEPIAKVYYIVPSKTGNVWNYLQDNPHIKEWTGEFEVEYDIDVIDSDAKTARLKKMSGALGDVEIPATVEKDGVEYTIVEVGEDWNNLFDDGLMQLVTSIILPKTVERINAAAFCWCNSLESVTLNEGLKVMEQDVFYGCPKLKELTLPSTLEDTWGRFITPAPDLVINTDKVSRMDVINGVLYDKVSHKVIQSVNGNIYFPEGAESTDISAFTDCKGDYDSATGKYSVTIPGSVGWLSWGTFINAYVGDVTYEGSGQLNIDCNRVFMTPHMTSFTAANTAQVYINNMGEPNDEGCYTLGYYDNGNGSVLPIDGFTIYGVVGESREEYNEISLYDYAALEKHSHITFESTSETVEEGDWTIFVGQNEAKILAYKSTVTIVEKIVPAGSIEIPETLTLKKGEEETLEAILTPTDATDKVTWKSDKPEVASVDADGKVTAEAVGTATITATAGKVSDTCAVTVTCAHKLVPVGPVDSTCKEQGHDAYQKCEYCGQLFDEDGKKIDEVPLRPLGDHTGGTATCKEQAVCTVCGKPYGDLADHDYGDLIEKKETCTKGVMAHYECSVCGKLFDENKKETTAEKLIIPAKGHTPGEWQYNDEKHWRVCTVCEAVIDEAAHTMVEKVTKPATEEETGLKHMECECGYKTADEEIPKLDHVHVMTHHAAVEADCCKGNVEYWTCSSDKCKGIFYGDADGSTVLDEVEIRNPDNHADYGTKTDKTTAKAATCTEDGKKADVVCKGCGEVIKEGEVILAKGHKFSKKWKHDAENHWHECTVCGEKTDIEAHVFSEEWTYDSEEHWHECKCGMKADAAKHTWKLDEGKSDATKNVYVCECGAEYEEALTPPAPEKPQIATGSGVLPTYKYSITYAGYEDHSETVVEDGKVKPFTPEKEGYTFAGWYLDAALTIKFNPDDPVRANRTLYPKWVKASAEDISLGAGLDSVSEDIASNGNTPAVVLMGAIVLLSAAAFYKKHKAEKKSDRK